MLKSKVKLLLTRLESTYLHKSFSQEGEDLILHRYFEGRSSGFYIDIGAHHPFRFSNTYLFYKKGWRGINVDATPKSMVSFKRHRKKDINLEIAVSDSKKDLIFHCMNDGALNTFSESLAKEREALGYKVIKKIKIQTTSLKDILSENLPPKTKIDFLSIDLEGEDFNALKSNDWMRFRPELILIEVLSKDFLVNDKSETHNYLTNLGYALMSKTINTYFYKDLNNQ